MSPHLALALAAIPCGLPVHQGRVIFCTVIGCMVLAMPVFAQLPPAASAASAPGKASPQELAEKQTTSVFRWIKIMADAPQRRVEAPKPQSRQEAVVTTPRPPVTKKPVATPNETGSSEANAVISVPRPASEPALSEPTDATSAVSVNAMPLATSQPVLATNVTAAAATPPFEVEPTLKLVSQTQPKIPDSVQEEDASGKVVVEFTVQPDGTVSKARAVNYTNRKLSKPAVDAVLKWRFESLRTALTAQVEIEFKLQ